MQEVVLRGLRGRPTKSNVKETLNEQILRKQIAEAKQDSGLKTILKSALVAVQPKNSRLSLCGKSKTASTGRSTLSQDGSE
eukprot:4542775-Amphidinium_carterae.1